jgi:hypothetical protein
VAIANLYENFQLCDTGDKLFAGEWLIAGVIDTGD